MLFGLFEVSADDRDGGLGIAGSQHLDDLLVIGLDDWQGTGVLGMDQALDQSGAVDVGAQEAENARDMAEM